MSASNSTPESGGSRLASLAGERFDVIVVGGGVIGAGVARDAALRGLSVALFERRDYGSGTTSGSTRLIHGGLRYLEMLDFRLVRMDLRERETLLRIAPHLVKPLEFVMPFYGRSLFHRAKIRIGMTLYDLLSYDKTLPRHRFLDAREVEQLEPNLRRRGLQGAASYFDAQVNSPERLCLENIIDAAEHGARTFNYAEVTGALGATGGAIRGVRVRDLLGEGGAEVDIRSRVVVNASGAWFDRVAGVLTGAPAPALIRTTKGAHVACPPVTTRAVVLFSPVDGRLMFVIPWLGYSWIGTTDTDFTDDPSKVRADAADVDYMIRSAREYFPTLDAARIYFGNAGVRALVREDGSESSVSRMHRVADGARAGAENLISVLGGKITGYRAIAEEVTDAVCEKLKARVSSSTAREPLPGARGGSAKVSNVSGANSQGEALENACDASGSSGLGGDTVAHLLRLYGSRAWEVVRLAASDESLRAPLSPHAPDLAAQVVFAARAEQCARLVDFLARRTLLGFSRDQGRGAATKAAALLARELGWSSARVDEELRLYQEYVAAAQAFRDGTSESSSSRSAPPT
ncbi:MAG: glycerol-3-phosphate dehydrogenase/oxidase [Acidobacteria bacterium]|nr:glycerol-3-phosphate dehydrogenase/oxidase [Acidobacteriota bacterium]MCA1641651.1 glycerol-3-phosphate dehydrogenase/oxidase [Acidobacteriota bacterium]